MSDILPDWSALIASSVRLNVFEAGVGIILIVCEGVTVFYEMLYIVDWYCKAESAEEYISHIRNTDDLAGQVKQRPAGVAGIYIGISLDIDKPLEGPVCCADDAVGYGSLQAERIADSEDLFADFNAQC